MTWVRYDDNVRNHPKVEPLDDAPYRLWREAIEWCAQNLTDGVVRTRQLGLTSTRATPGRAKVLVAAELWHVAGETCDSDRCPASPSSPSPAAATTGWVVHDYFDYQPTAEQVRDEQAKARDRKRRWLENRRNGGGNGVPHADPNGEPNRGKNDNPVPSHPIPPRKGGDGMVASPPSPPTPRAPRCPDCGNPADSSYHRNVCRRAAGA